MKQMKIGTINISQQANNHTSGQKPNNLNRQTPNNISRQTPNNVSRQAPNNLNRQTPSQINRQTIKQNNVKRHKKKYKKNFTLHYILLFILVTTTFAILSYTVLFNVKEIEIIGADNLDIEKIKQDINVPIGKSLLKVDTKEIEEKLFKQYYQLATVQADRKFPNKLKISLTPAQPYMCISKGADYFYISENLRVIDRKNINVDKCIEVLGVDIGDISQGEYVKPTEENNLELVLESYSTIINSSLKDITKIDMTDIMNVNIYCGNRILIKVGAITNLQYKLDTASQIIMDKIAEGQYGVLDVQITGKAFFKETGKDFS